MKLTKRAPTAELMGPKNGKIIAKNHIGITTGSLASALRQRLLVSWMPITFSHTKYSGVHANPNVINCAYGEEIDHSSPVKQKYMQRIVLILYRPGE